MRSNSRQSNFNLNNQNEYQRQQERLKSASATTDKANSMTTDLMIENLLKQSTIKSVPQNERPDPGINLPNWLRCESSFNPSEYKYLWSLVQSNNVNLADTQKVSKLLLTSRLPLDVLGHIWNTANKAIPGLLTKQEFYIVLALVGLAQNGASFNNLSALTFVPSPIIPLLQIDIFNSEFPKPQILLKNVNLPNTGRQVNSSTSQQMLSLSSTMDSEQIVHQKTTSESVPNERTMFESKMVKKPDKKNFSLEFGKYNEGENRRLPYQAISNSHQFHSNFPCIGSSPTTELEDDFSDFQSGPAEQPGLELTSKGEESNDEFTDFQCATLDAAENSDPFETVIIQQKKPIPKILLPKSLTGKFTNLKSNILKVSPESERKLRVISRNESLSSLPESKISSTNTVSTSMSVLCGNHGLESALPSHPLSIKSNHSKLFKHHKTKPGSSRSPVESADEEIIFGVNTKNFEGVIPKCCPKKPATFLLKDTKITDVFSSSSLKDQSVGNEIVPENLEPASIYSIRENTRTIEIPMVGTFNETVLPTSRSKANSSSEGGDVDLFSVEEDKYSALRDLELTYDALREPSGQVPEATNDDFGDFLSADIPEPISQEPKQTTFFSSASDSTIESDDKDNWGEWSSGVTVGNDARDNINVELFENSCDPTAAKESITNIDQTLAPKTTNNHDSFNLLQLEEELLSDPCSEIKIPQMKGDSSISDLFPSHAENSVDQPLNRPVEENFEFPKVDSESSENFPLTPEAFGNSSNNDDKNNCNSDVSNSNRHLESNENEVWDLFVPASATPQDNLKRHDSLPSLDFKVDTGEWTSEQEIVWKKCLETCENIIQEGVDIFESIANKQTLKEVFAIPKTKDYLKGLRAAYEITRRINQNNGDPLSIQEDLDRLWRILEKLAVKYDVRVEEDLDSVADGTSHCKICLGYVGSEHVNQGGHAYHCSCANLWINCIDGNLPFAP